MSVFKRGKVWWYEFWFAGRRIQESTKATSKTVAKLAEQKRRRELEEGFNIRQKARRGELQFRLPIGFRWTPNGKVEIDPDRRVQEAVHLVFTKMVELGSARQVPLWFRGENTNLPALVLETPGHDVLWKLPVYNTIWHMLRNPMYAGAYAFGKTESRTKVIDGRARKSEGHVKSRDTHGWS